MPLVEVEINVRVDGIPAPGFPVTLRRNPAEAVINKLVLPHGGMAGVFNILSKLNTDNIFIIQTDTPINVRLNNQTTAQIPLNAGGILLMIDGVLSAGANVNILVNNVQPLADATLTTLEVGP